MRHQDKNNNVITSNNTNNENNSRDNPRPTPKKSRTSGPESKAPFKASYHRVAGTYLQNFHSRAKTN